MLSGLSWKESRVLRWMPQGIWSSLLLLASFILISLWKPFGLVVITFVFSGPNSILYIVVVLSRQSTRMPASSSSSAFTTMSSAKRKLVISPPPMLTLPSWSSNASHTILSRKMLKRAGESRHPCRTPTVVLNHSPVLPLNKTALWALSYRFSYDAGVDVVFPHSCPYSFVKGLFEVYEDMVEILLMLQVFLTENPENEYLFCGVPSGSETCLLFCNDIFCLWLESL